MPFQWICGVSTNNGDNTSKSSIGFKGARKHDQTQLQSNLPDAVAGLMPFRCPLQGVGISGPCKTPDYVPASHFLAATGHVINSPLSDYSPMIVTPLESDQRIHHESSANPVPISLSPHTSPLVSAKVCLNLPVEETPSASAVETTVVLPVNGKDWGFNLSQEPIQDDMVGEISHTSDSLIFRTRIQGLWFKIMKLLLPN